MIDDQIIQEIRSSNLPKTISLINDDNNVRNLQKLRISQILQRGSEMNLPLTKDKIRILIVDDEIYNHVCLIQIGKSLRTLIFSSAFSGEQCLEMCQE